MAVPSPKLRAQELPAASTTLETLVPHLLAAKRSLSCVEHVSHANDIANTTRQSLEHHTILTARTLFIRNGSKAQLSTLDRVREHTTSIAREAGDEFQNVIDNLDSAESRLRKTLEQLRSTQVDRKLRVEEEEPKYLSDFVDETGVQTLLSDIKESINNTGQARKTFDQAIESLEDEIEKIKELLASTNENAEESTTHIELQSPVPEILHTMESQASDMARNLESLVKHFDLCVTAIKHTEGGGAAASMIARDLPDGMDLKLGTDEGPLERFSDAEMKDMLEVLEKDAGEVDEVVNEMKTIVTEIEANAERVEALGGRLNFELSRTIEAFKLLQDLGNRLPGYITQSQIFAYQWDEERGKIHDYIKDLDGWRGFYSNFIHAYDNLLIEVGRRKDVEKRIARIRQDALTKIDRLVQEETMERQAFRQEQGDFLPVDIWPGLVKAPAKYELNKVEGAADSIPDISASVINKAIKRVSAQRKSKTNET